MGVLGQMDPAKAFTCSLSLKTFPEMAKDLTAKDVMQFDGLLGAVRFEANKLELEFPNECLTKFIRKSLPAPPTAEAAKTEPEKSAAP